MATGYTCLSASVKVDIDTLFLSRTSTKRANVGFKSNGSDISNLFEPSTGGDTIPFNTGFKSSNSDISTLFKAWIKYYLTVYSGSGDGQYNKDVYASITADTAPTHYQFNQWIGSGITNVNNSTTTVLMDADKIVSASYSLNNYTLTILSGSGGGTQPYGYEYSITASSYNGLSFSSWETRVGTIYYDNQFGYQTTATIASNATTEATFVANDYDLTVVGGTGGGTKAYVPPDGATYSVTSSTVPTGYSFNTWTITSGNAGMIIFGNQNAEKTTVKIGHQDATISGSFNINQYTLTVVFGTGGGTADYGNVYNIVAGSYTGFSFTNWQTNAGSITYGDINDPTTTATIGAANATTEAVYDANDYTLTVVSGSGGGTQAYVDPNGYVYTITANSVTGYTFSNWQTNAGSISYNSSTSATTTCTIGAGNATTEATYTINQYTLTVVYGSGGGTQNYNHTYNISADTYTGYTFNHWQTNAGTITYGDANDPTTTATIGAANATTEAVYTANSYTLTVVNGSGGGTYAYSEPNGHVYNITANAPQNGYIFNGWTGTAGSPVFGNASNSSTTCTIGAGNATVQANYIQWSG